MSYEYKSGTQLLEERYITFDEVGLTGPDQTPGSLWSVGYNTYGELGLGDRTHRSSPVQVGSLTNWKDVSRGIVHTIAIKTDGTLWAWGRGSRTISNGWLGLGDTTHRSSPTQVGSLTNWKQVSTSKNGQDYYTASCAVKTDGTLWLWGYGLNILGASNAQSPIQFGTDTNWKQVVVEKGSGSSELHLHAIKTDGSLWSWGNNDTGALGLGDTTHRSSPVQVGTLTNWKVLFNKYSGVYAIKTDGSLWSWGYNAMFGNSNYSSPVQLGTDTNWKQVSAGSNFALGIKIDGSLWAWGSNTNGQLGLGSTTSYTGSPVQVGSLTNWKNICAITPTGWAVPGSAMGVKTDGTLWAWGTNTDGQLGLGDTTHRSSPVQVGSLTNWKSAVGAGNVSIMSKLNT